MEIKEELSTHGHVMRSSVQSGDGGRVNEPTSKRTSERASEPLLGDLKSEQRLGRIGVKFN